MVIELQYPLGSYSIDNPPSNETLKGDLSTVQTAVNAGEIALTAHEADTSTHGVATVAGVTETQTLTNKTLTSPKINEDVALTATATELNVLDGMTASTAELNVLDGIPATLTATELGYVDGVTSAIQTQINTKAPTASPSFTGTVTFPTGLTGVLRADSGVVATDSNVTDLVSAASETVAGKVELATDAETLTGTDTARAVTPANIRSIKASGSDVATGTDDAKYVTSKAIKDANILSQSWSSYTPSFTNLTVGSGTLVAAYTRIGKTVHFRISLVFGAGTAVSGEIIVTLPATSISYPGIADITPLGNVTILDNGTNLYNGLALWHNTTSFIVRASKSDGTYTSLGVACSSTVPITWVVGDTLIMEGTYEAA